MPHNKETCLGVFSLQTASWIITFIQLFYNVFYILSDIAMLNSVIKTVDTDTFDHTAIAIAVTYYIGSAVSYFMGVCAAIIVITGHIV